MHLPPICSPLLWVDSGHTTPLRVLAGGIIAYFLSTGCWFMALRRLPLNLAYPLLSLSYVLVAIFSLMIPAFHETYTLSRLMGVALICSGVWLIYHPSGRNNK
nr:EamA family transporter [secondary endosymbiont of Ctenarytaina eucalypti]